MIDKKEKQSEHEFAFYYSTTTRDIIQAAQDHKQYELTDEQLCRRINAVLRMHEGETFILFDATHNAQCTIIKLGKRITIQCDKPLVNTIIKPSITFFLPLLKREAFEEAIYSLTELGVNTIQPVLTAKTHRQISNAKDFERLQRIIYAAAEQSKNFAFPLLKQPIEFDELKTALIPQDSIKLFFDPEGEPVSEILKTTTMHSQLMLMIGPEGDLTAEEKNTLKQLSFTFCKLTPTILRAQQAAAIALGVVRSLR